MCDELDCIDNLMVMVQMGIVFDLVKDVVNIVKYGLLFLDFCGFDGELSIYVDDCYDYGEV